MPQPVVCHLKINLNDNYFSCSNLVFIKKKNAHHLYFYFVERALIIIIVIKMYKLINRSICIIYYINYIDKVKKKQIKLFLGT